MIDRLHAARDRWGDGRASGRSMVAEFGPTPFARYPELADTPWDGDLTANIAKARRMRVRAALRGPQSAERRAA